MRRAAFTLIELLLVLTIIGLLLVVLLPRLVEPLQRGRARQTQLIEQQIAGMVDSFENENGDFPASDYQGLASHPPNDLNTGAESLVALLAAPDYAGPKPEERMLVNSDEDRFPTRVTAFAVDDAFEVQDAWKNPIAYFHSRGYGKRQAYRCAVEAGTGGDYDVEARRSRKTGNFLRPEDYQLISAGKDGAFGTPDDIVLGEDG